VGGGHRSSAKGARIEAPRKVACGDGVSRSRLGAKSGEGVGPLPRIFVLIFFIIKKVFSCILSKRVGDGRGREHSSPIKKKKNWKIFFGQLSCEIRAFFGQISCKIRAFG